MSFFKNTIVRYKRKAIRDRMRGYRILKDSGRLDLLVRIKEEFTNSNLSDISSGALHLFFGAGLPNAEIIVKQFMLQRFVELDFNSKLLQSIGKGKYELFLPLPYEWRLIVEKYGFKTDTFLNKLIWLSHVFLVYVKGAFIGIHTLVISLFTNEDSRNITGGYNSVYFHALTKNNLPHKSKDENSYDIITWYSQWKNKKEPVSTYFHNVKNCPQTELDGIPIISVKSAITTLKGFNQIGAFILGLCWLPILAIFDLIRGRYWHALLLGESIRSFHFRLLNPVQISSDYLFHNSGYLYRPIWTYDAEKFGSRILFYFYSTNIERFKEPHGYDIQPYSWSLISWSKYLVWDEYQADFVNRNTNRINNIEIVGPINFSDSSIGKVEIPNHSILVFDVQPHRDSKYQILGVVPEYFIPSVVNQFLEDIFWVSNKYGFFMVLKRKREIGNLLNKKYSSLIHRLQKSDNFISIDPNLAAKYLIKKVEVVISLPFTSTALIARDEGKLSIFYDPSGIIQKDDRAAHGIKVISGKAELDEWFQEQITIK
ncbi:polysaccharide biosynthesis PFTS motif protein [Aquirufa salirivi]|uniref:Polysaccharide biosynthesis PFTS motif protein n=1 Tax=Aquirufa salirivi TaxID=3104729 RepID=A0ABW8RWF5_9BACT